MTAIVIAFGTQITPGKKPVDPEKGALFQERGIADAIDNDMAGDARFLSFHVGSGLRPYPLICGYFAELVSHPDLPVIFQGSSQIASQKRFPDPVLRQGFIVFEPFQVFRAILSGDGSEQNPGQFQRLIQLRSHKLDLAVLEVRDPFTAETVELGEDCPDLDIEVTVSLAVIGEIQSEPDEVGAPGFFLDGDENARTVLMAKQIEGDLLECVHGVEIGEILF